MVVTSVLRLRRYSAVRTREGAKFLELRVAGLALERGYKAARDVGLGALDETHVDSAKKCKLEPKRQPAMEEIK